SKRSSIGASIAANSPLYPHRIVPPFLLCSVYPDRRAFLAPGTSSLHRSVDFIRPFQRRHPMRSCVRCVSCGRLWTVDGGSMSPEEPGRSTGTPAGVERMTRRDVMSRMSITVVMAKIARVTAVTLTLAVGLAAPGRAEAQSGAVIRNWNNIACAQAFGNPVRLSRILAIVHVAQHDAVNGAVPRYTPYVSTLTDLSADAEAAAA